MNGNIKNIVDPGARGFFLGHAGGYYQNPYNPQSAAYTDFKNGWDAGRNYLRDQLNKIREAS